MPTLPYIHVHTHILLPRLDKRIGFQGSVWRPKHCDASQRISPQLRRDSVYKRLYVFNDLLKYPLSRWGTVRQLQRPIDQFNDIRIRQGLLARVNVAIDHRLQLVGVELFFFAQGIEG